MLHRFKLIYSFNDGVLKAIHHVLRFLLTQSLIGTAIKTFHVNACVRLLFKCLDGSNV